MTPPSAERTVNTDQTNLDTVTAAANADGSGNVLTDVRDAVNHLLGID